MRVLLVEDDAAVREALGDLLIEAGHAVTSVGTFGEAAELLERAPCDVLLADLMLPGGSGLDLATQARTQGLGAVLCSGHPARIEQLRGRGIVYLVKPFSAEALEAALTAVAHGADR